MVEELLLNVTPSVSLHQRRAKGRGLKDREARLPQVGSTSSGTFGAGSKGDSFLIEKRVLPFKKHFTFSSL